MDNEKLNDELNTPEEGGGKEKPPELSKDIYEKMSTEVAEREIEIDLPKSNGGHKSYSESVQSPNTTDLQASLHRLFPNFKNISIDYTSRP